MERSGFDVCPPRLIFNRHVEHRNHRTREEQCPAEQCEELNGRLDPVEVKDVRSHIAHHGEEIGNRAVNHLVRPLQKRIKNHVGKMRPQRVKNIADYI